VLHITVSNENPTLILNSAKESTVSYFTYEFWMVYLVLVWYHDVVCAVILSHCLR